jgi:hypothetical protein
LPEKLNPGQGVLSQFNGDRKILLDRSFTRMLCKGCRPLSLGEDKHFKQWVLQVTGARYTVNLTSLSTFYLDFLVFHLLACCVLRIITYVCIIFRYQPPCIKGVVDSLLWLSAAATKKVSEEITHHVHEERLDLSVSGEMKWKFPRWLAYCK